MIYRHCIAPPRAYTQFSHDIIRHPRLSSDAVRLLTWQLSLPQGTRESLSRTAERANIGACAFTRAKRQLKGEGFVHERRVQGPGGHWVTQQLVSNVPLSAAEAAKLLGQVPVPASSPSSPQLAPSPRDPAVGEPTSPPTDGLPRENPCRNTHDRPPKPPEDCNGGQDRLDGRPELPAATPPHHEAARTLAAAYRDLDPALRHIPRPMLAELTNLTARWLAAGHQPAAIRAHILRNLPDDGTPVHRPGGLLRHLLSDVPPAQPAPSAQRAQPTAAPAPGHRPSPATSPTGALLSPRLAGTRECEGDHVQPTLFRPTGDEPLCPACAARRTPPAAAIAAAQCPTT
ncbi:hypothetical protein [Streptomyces sp. NPDC047869]|uniref:hypothetical protein n=1 Tax=Streptomyces sp. NPDC047869 TaxID=3154709 RepID=UPI003455AEF4